MAKSVRIALAISLGVACSSSKQTPAPAGDEHSSGAEVRPHDTLQGHMAANFELALRARDGVIAGSLIQAKEAAAKLAEQDYSTVLPPEWMPGVKRMQDAARQLGVADDIESAANGVATLAAACGDCHASGNVVVIRSRVAPPDLKFGEAEDMRARMQRHQRAATGFWYGLTAPSDEAWRSAAQALLDSPLSPTDDHGKPVSEATVAKIEKVRDIAKRALNVTDTAERTTLYGGLIGTCAHCHSGK